MKREGSDRTLPLPHCSIDIHDPPTTRRGETGSGPRGDKAVDLRKDLPAELERQAAGGEDEGWKLHDPS